MYSELSRNTAWRMFQRESLKDYSFSVCLKLFTPRFSLQVSVIPRAYFQLCRLLELVIVTTLDRCVSLSFALLVPCLP